MVIFQPVCTKLIFNGKHKILSIKHIQSGRNGAYYLCFHTLVSFFSRGKTTNKGTTVLTENSFRNDHFLNIFFCILAMENLSET